MGLTWISSESRQETGPLRLWVRSRHPKGTFQVSYPSTYVYALLVFPVMPLSKPPLCSANIFRFSSSLCLTSEQISIHRLNKMQN